MGDVMPFVTQQSGGRVLFLFGCSNLPPTPPLNNRLNREESNVLFLLGFVIGITLGLYIRKSIVEAEYNRKLHYFQTSETPIGDMLAKEMGIKL